LSDTVVINGQAVATGPVTIVCHNGPEDVSIPGHVGIDAEVALYHAERVRVLHDLTRPFFAIVFPDAPKSLFNVTTRGQHGTGYRHLLGRVDMTLKFIDAGCAFFWRYPEAFLHPSAQRDLADLVLALSRYQRDGVCPIDPECRSCGCINQKGESRCVECGSDLAARRVKP